jgi:subtilisin family serine protease
MVEYRAKFDSQLRDIHTSFLDLQRGNRDRIYPLHSAALPEGPVSLLLQFGDDLAGIEARGFRTQWVEGNFARGDVELADLEAVASHPEVIQLAYGGDLKPLLDTSAEEINARGPLTTAVWTVDKATGKFDGHRGTGVLIGIIDTGIDIHHPVFLKPGSKDTTRIRRIWDMGIKPHDGATKPDVSLIQGGFSYGVEYTDTMINAALKTPPGTVKHKDCVGHGTQMASIAAGDGRAEREKKKYEFVGVAPEADLIVVKMLFLENDPVQNGRKLTAERRLEDAISYIERVAKTEDLKNRPVVINVSLGTETGPHDGLSPFELRLDDHFRTATKVALVAAAGNEAGSRQHAVITVPAGGTINVPFTLYDDRTPKKDHAHCGETARPNARPELEIEFWYRQLGPQQKLTASLKPPGAKDFVNGPALGGAAVERKYRRNQPFRIEHEVDKTQRSPTVPVTRNVLRIKFTPVDNTFGSGLFTLRLTGPNDTIIHAWGTQAIPLHGFRMGHDKPRKKDKPVEMENPPNGMVVNDASTLSSPGTSAGAITVAYYDDFDFDAVTDFSSHGPLVDYSLAALGPYAAKPDLAAPGFEIESAISSDSLPRAHKKKVVKKVNPTYASGSGSSAAAPHVAGVAALMFEKNNNLTRAEILKKLTDHVRKHTPTDLPNIFGAGRVDAFASRKAV